jgi:hypothetical protein
MANNYYNLHHYIYIPATDETIPDGGIFTIYNDLAAVSLLADHDSFHTDGEVLYEFDGNSVLKGEFNFVQNHPAGWSPL